MVLGEEKISEKLRLALKSGKFTIGHNTTIKELSSGNCKLILIANNCPPVKRLEIEYYAMLVKCPLHHFPGTNSELGLNAGCKFSCSCIGIIDSGDADLSIYALN
mmetsp:Transcript_18264/g.28378  ORF Transcript_18264/g.28378 Transcript_18264/m.28378 type:complete len:105 (-) Transcript_18264:6302-6616(-)